MSLAFKRIFLAVGFLTFVALWAIAAASRHSPCPDGTAWKHSDLPALGNPLNGANGEYAVYRCAPRA